MFKTLDPMHLVRKNKIFKIHYVRYYTVDFKFRLYSVFRADRKYFYLT